jgi:hypothetical protein
MRTRYEDGYRVLTLKGCVATTWDQQQEPTSDIVTGGSDVDDPDQVFEAGTAESSGDLSFRRPRSRHPELTTAERVSLAM